MNNFKQNSIILQLQISKGKGLNKTDFNDVLKQCISTTNGKDAALHQLKHFRGMSCCFFGVSSNLPNQIMKLIEATNKHLLSFEGLHLRDEYFFTKFGYDIDTRIFVGYKNACKLKKEMKYAKK